MFTFEIPKATNVFPYHIKENSNLIGKMQVKDGFILCTLGEYYRMHERKNLSRQNNSGREEVEYFENNFIKSFGYPRDYKGREFVPPWCGEEFICFTDVSVNDIYAEGEGDIAVVLYDFFLQYWEENSFYPVTPKY